MGERGRTEQRADALLFHRFDGPPGKLFVGEGQVVAALARGQAVDVVEMDDGPGTYEIDVSAFAPGAPLPIMFVAIPRAHEAAFRSMSAEQVNEAINQAVAASRSSPPPRSGASLPDGGG